MVLMLSLDYTTFKFYNISLVLNYNLNLILLKQIQKSQIIYYKDYTIMTLIKNKKIII